MMNLLGKTCGPKGGCCWEPGALMRSMENWGDNCGEGSMGSHLRSMLGCHGGGQELCHMLHEWADDVMVTENDSSYRVAVAVPGVKMSDISLNLRECGQMHYLELQWHRDCASDVHADHVRWMGKTWSKCYKRLPLPESCELSGIDAFCENGELVITIHKKRGFCGSDANGKAIKVRSRN